MNRRKFFASIQRLIRPKNFKCGKCSKMIRSVHNHCPYCLWSKHAIRVSKKSCKGLMEPVGIALGLHECTITHRCTKCDEETHHRTGTQDNFTALTMLSINQNEVLLQSCDESPNPVLSSAA